MEHLKLHTRHIPLEHLCLDVAMGRRVRDNGMCDVLKPERLKQLKELGVTVVETRVVWSELEPKPGCFDWSRLDRDIALIEAGGMEPAVFPWFQHPPKWEHELIRSRCLEHDHEISIPSLWDSRLIETYDRLYGAMKAHYGNRLRYIQACCYGDYGEVLYPIGVKHYNFNWGEGHFGFWCGDRLARADFQKYLQRKYQTLTELNRNWGAAFADWNENFMPILPFSQNPLKRRIDFAKWYSDSLMDFTDRALAAMRKHFPDVEGGVAIGAPYEPLEVGQIKSRSAKLAAKYDLTPRWTAAALFHENVARSNFQARRLSTAARFYGKRFGTEAALEIKDAIPALCELAVNGATMFHNDPGNFDCDSSFYTDLLPHIPPALPVYTPVCVFYPVEGEFCHCLEKETDPDLQNDNNFAETQQTLPREHIDTFLDACMELRRKCDFEVLDSFLIEDGALERFQYLVLPCALPIPESAARKIGEWVRKGGTLISLRNRPPRILENSMSLGDFAQQAGFSIVETDEFPDIEPFSSFQRKYGDDLLVFWHGGDRVTLYSLKEKSIKIAISIES